MPSEIDEWFVREVLVHERALAGYLRRCWPHGDEWHDLQQEVYARVYEAASRNRPAAPEAFVFTTARHLLTDRARRSRVVSIETVGDFTSPNVNPVDELSPERWMDSRQMLRRLSEALDHLPDRCRAVVWLRRVEELPQKEVARRLGISDRTVEKHLARGMRLVAACLYGSAPPPAREGTPPWAARMDEDDGDARQQAD